MKYGDTLADKPLRLKSQKPDKVCSVDECGKRVRSHGLCNAHSIMQARHGRTYSTYVTGKVFLHHGYVVEYNPSHIQADKGGKVLQHARIMSDHLERRLHTFETVHHKNGVKDDNRLENLELWASRHPKGQRVEDLVEFGIQILSEYKPELLVKKE
ncbi:MAG: HNH endonuclease [Acidobacteriota bacterium]|nr:HNH endonuclease [Acidobacteriota bacterium]